MTHQNQPIDGIRIDKAIEMYLEARSDEVSAQTLQAHLRIVEVEAQKQMDTPASGFCTA